MKELLRGESTISLDAAVLKCPNAELYRLTFFPSNTLLNLVKEPNRKGGGNTSEECRLAFDKPTAGVKVNQFYKNP
jgi:hypothetical protein